MGESTTFAFSKLRASRPSYMTSIPNRYATTLRRKWGRHSRLLTERNSWQSSGFVGLITKSWSNGCSASFSISTAFTWRWARLQVWQTKVSRSSNRRFSYACSTLSPMLWSNKLRQIEGMSPSTQTYSSRSSRSTLSLAVKRFLVFQ